MTAHRSLLVALALLAACEREATIAVNDAGPFMDAGPGVNPGADACQPLCDGRECGDDGCGGACGQCGADATCDLITYRCICEPESRARFCARLGKECGEVTGTDNCGAARAEFCGECQAPSTCDETSHCRACVPETDGELCGAAQVECGPLSAVDRCGTAREIPECGPCPAPTTECDAATARCVEPCAPEDDATFCAERGKQCGPAEGLDHCEANRLVAECGPCAATELCSASQTCVFCQQETDADLCAFYFKNCGVPALVDSCGVPRMPACGSCSAADESCQPTNVCGTPGRPTNDTCAAPVRLVFDATGTATATADTAGADDSVNNSCGGYGGADVFYAFTLTATKRATVTFSPANPATQPVVSLRANCSDPLDFVCATPAAAGQPQTFVVPLEAGTYLLAVDTWGGSLPGPVSIAVVLSDPPPPPPNDTCAAPAPLAFTNRVATAAGDTFGALDDYTDACQYALGDGPEVVYGLTLSTASAIAVRVTRDATALTFEPIVRLLSSCPSPAGALGCGNAVDGVAALGNSDLAAGTYYLVVDGKDRSAGRYTLEVTLSDPIPNDTCAGAADVPLSAITGTPGALNGEVTGDTSAATDDYNPCGYGPTGRDLVYSFTLPAGGGAKDVTIQIGGTPGSAFEPIVALRADCYAGADITCAIAYIPEYVLPVSVRRLPPGTYYLVVDGWQPTTNGPFTLAIAATDPPPPPPNDVCGHGIVVALDPNTGTGQASGSTSDALDDYAGSCAAGSVAHTGGDTVYTVSLTSTATLRAAVTATSPGYRPAVYIQTTCGDSTSDRGCGVDDLGVAAALAPNLPAGTYSVIVDGLDGTSGSYSLDLLAFAPLTNDTCLNPTTMLFDSNGDFTAHGDSCTLRNDAVASMSGTCFGAGSGNDNVYKLVLAQEKDLGLTLSPGHYGASYLYLRTACNSAPSELACGMGLGFNTLTLKRLAPGTYYVWLDSDWMCGLYTLTAHLSDPPTPQSNDLCSAPELVTLDPTTGLGSASGNTEAATGDLDGACRPSGSGPELVYAFTLSAASTVDVTVTPQPGSSLEPVVYLRTGCALPRTELGCRAEQSQGTAAHLRLPRLDAGTYQVIVDSYDRNDSGPFDLAIAATPVGPTGSNDLCANALALPAFDPTTHVASVSGNTLDGTDDETSLCGRGWTQVSGPDLAYSFTLAADARVRATVTRAATATTYLPAVSIRSSCVLEDEVACKVDYGSGAASVADVSLTSGTYYVIVDGADHSFGEFTLEVEDLGPALPGDNCGAALPLTFSASGAASATGDLSAGFRDQLEPGCTPGSSGADIVYAFTTTADEVVTVTLAAPATGGQLRPLASLRQVCDDAAGELGCAASTAAGGSTSFTTSRLRAGTYYVVVDSLGLASPFELTVQLNLPVGGLASNDACAGASPLALDPATGTGVATGDTRAAYDDYAGTCSYVSEPLSGGDLVYSVTVPRSGTTLAAAVVADATTTPRYLPAVYLRGANCASADPLDELGCSGSGALTVSSLQAGTYYLVVDGRRGSSGAFSLEVATRTSAIINDQCATAEPLPFDSAGVAEVFGDTSLGAANAQGPGSCFSSGPELYYTVTTTAPKDLAVDLLPAGAQYKPVAYVRRVCTDPTTTKAWNQSNGAVPMHLSALRLPAGSYTIVVDSQFPADAGPFILRVTASDPPLPPAHDSCQAPNLLQLPAPGSPVLRLTDSTLGASDDLTSVCATASDPLDGPDLVYSFTLAAPARLTAVVTPKPSSPRYKPAVYVRRACATISNDACRMGASTGGAANPATLTVSLDSGSYYLVVDGASGTAGDFDLELSQSTLQYREADHCINAGSLDPLFVTGTAPDELVATVTGDTSGATNDTSGSCNPSSGPDLVYSFTTVADSLVTVSVAPATGSTYKPHLVLRSTCTDPASELYCRYQWSTSPLTGTLYHLPVGTYYVFVDGVSSWPSSHTDGPFTLQVRLRPTPAAPANDLCGHATVLGFQTVAGSTLQTASVAADSNEFANDDDSGSCLNGSGGGNEVVYAFTLASAQSFTATVIPDTTVSPDFVPAVYLRTGCAPAAGLSEVTCARAPGTYTPVMISANSLPAGTYYLFVDTSRQNPTDPPGGAFSLSATIDAPLPGPANDGCAFAQTIALTGPAPSVTTLSGQTTVGAHDDASGCGASSDGPDVVYRLDLPTASQVSLRVTPTNGLLPAVYLRAGCASRTTMACAANPYASNPVEASRAYLAAGTYYVWVDAAASYSSGSFDLEITLSTPTVIPPANDLCSATTPVLTQGVPVTGTTVGAFNDYAGLSNAACGYSNSASGPDVVFAYTPATNGPISVTLVSNGADLMPWMSEAVCGEPAACVAATDNGGAYGGVDTMTYYQGRAGVTYYIHVDSNQSTTTGGTFTLTVD